MISIAVALVFFALTPLELEYESAPSLKERGEIVGQVLNDRGEPIQYANIQLVGTMTGAMSDERGEFKLQDLEPGAYDLRVMMMNQYRQEQRIEIVPSIRARITLRMKYGENIPGQFFCPKVGP